MRRLELLATLALALVFASPGDALVCEEPGGRSVFMEANVVVIAEVVAVKLPWWPYRVIDEVLLRIGHSVPDDLWEFLGIGPYTVHLRTLETLAGHAPRSFVVEGQRLSMCCTWPTYYPGERVLAFLRRESLWNHRWVTTGAGDGTVWVPDDDSADALALAAAEGLELARGTSEAWHEWALRAAESPETRSLGLDQLLRLRPEDQARLADAFIAAPTAADFLRVLYRLRDYSEPGFDQLVLDFTSAWLEVEEAPRSVTLALLDEALDRIGAPDLSMAVRGTSRGVLRELWQASLAQRGLAADANGFLDLVGDYADRMAAIYDRLP